MKLSDFDFDLPESLIATRPAKPRSSARMLVAQGDQIEDVHAIDLASFLQPGDRLVLNDTKVIAARLFGQRFRMGDTGETAARIEVTLLEPRPEGTWRALIKPLKKLRDGETVVFSDALSARLVGREDGTGILEFNCAGDDFDAALADAGQMPLPPYIAAKRPADAKTMKIIKRFGLPIWVRLPPLRHHCILIRPCWSRLWSEVWRLPM